MAPGFTPTEAGYGRPGWRARPKCFLYAEFNNGLAAYVMDRRTVPGSEAGIPNSTSPSRSALGCRRSG